METPVLVERNDSLAIVTLNRPQVLNALNRETKHLLTNAFLELSADDAITAIVLTGAGERAFCAGQDIKESAGMTGEDTADWVRGFDTMYQSIRLCMKPVVASVFGYAAGSGFQLALLADVRIAAPSAKFGMTEIDVGIPCITGSALLWPILGRARTLDLILTGRFLSAAEAHAWGIVTEVVEQANPLARAIEVARALGAKPANAIRQNKQWINALTEDVYQRGVAFAQEAHQQAFASGDASEHMGRFLKQRS